MIPARETCPTCDASAMTSVRAHGVEPRYTLLHCQECGLEHWQPLAAPSADYYEGEEHSMYAALHDGSRKARSDPRFSRFLDEFGYSRGQTLLDVGCSDGTLLEAAAAQGGNVVGIDVDKRSLEVARRRGLEVYEATLPRFVSEQARGRRFDFVTMFDVLEHLTDPRRTLELAASLLKPGGRLVGTVPNRHRLFVNLIRSDFPPHHFFRFDRPSLERALQASGLVPERVDVFEWGYAGPVLLDVGVKLVKRAAGTRRGRNAEPAPSTPGGRTMRTATKLKHGVAAVLSASLGRASAPIERALGRGFKLYFVARREVS